MIDHFGGYGFKRQMAAGTGGNIARLFTLFKEGISKGACIFVPFPKP